MKKVIALLLISTAMLQGCATHAPTSDDTMQSALSQALEKRIIDCTLPYLSILGLSQADVRYHYLNGTAQFQTQNTDLTTHLQECAGPIAGPRGQFNGRIEIWPANAS